MFTRKVWSESRVDLMAFIPSMMHGSVVSWEFRTQPLSCPGTDDPRPSSTPLAELRELIDKELSQMSQRRLVKGSGEPQ